jgi:hypothetical protein
MGLVLRILIYVYVYIYIPGGGEISRTRLTDPGVNPASCTMGTGSFPGVKRPGRGVDHPLPSSAEVTNE